MDFHLTGEPPKSDNRIKALYCWIAIQPDGGEGIISADLPMPFGMRHCPLISSNKNAIEGLRDFAEMAQKKSSLLGTEVKVELREYVLK